MDGIGLLVKLFFALVFMESIEKKLCVQVGYERDLSHGKVYFCWSLCLFILDRRVVG